MLSEPLAHSDWTRGEIEHFHQSVSGYTDLLNILRGGKRPTLGRTLRNKGRDVSAVSTLVPRLISQQQALAEMAASLSPGDL